MDEVAEVSGEVPDAANAESPVIAVAEVDASSWDQALAYADYLHTDAVLLVLGVWMCAGIMLARLLLDRVVD